MLGYATRSFDQSSLTWDNQWNGLEFDPGRASGEQISNVGVNFLESGLGLNYRWQRSKRTKLDLGVGLYHVLEPNTSLFDSPGADTDITLPRRLSLTGIGTFQVASKLDIQLDALAQFQGEYNEVILGALGKIHVNQRRGKETELHIGGGWRTSGDLFPVIAVQHKNFYLSANYDVNISDFTSFGLDNPVNPNIPNQHDTPTSFEMHFTYIISDVRPFDKVKVCPIF